MRDEIVLKRYAEGFLGFAKETIGQDAAIEELKDFKAAVIHNNPEFIMFLESLEISYTEKCSFIDKVAVDFSGELKQFLKLLVEHGRINKLEDIIEYIRLKLSHGEEVDALLKTSFPLEIELIKKIKRVIENKLKKKLKLYIDLDGSLLGGIQVVIGNTIIDGSVSKRLFELRQKLETIRVN